MQGWQHYKPGPLIPEERWAKMVHDEGLGLDEVIEEAMAEVAAPPMRAADAGAPGGRGAQQPSHRNCGVLSATPGRTRALLI